MKRVDFHMHSNHSDGILSPAELMRRCHKQKLVCVALTDHDTISGYSEAAEQAQMLGFECVSGVELSVASEKGSLHLLGYFFDPKNENLKKCLADVQASRSERNPKIIEKLNELGLHLTLEDVREIAYRGVSDKSTKKQIGRPHFAQALIEKGYVHNSGEAFARYLGKEGTAFEEKWRLEVIDAIRIIREAGGIASLAHPYTLDLNEDDLFIAIKDMADAGLGAIEVYHSSHNSRKRKNLLAMAKRLNLATTGGSDFHGEGHPDLDVGRIGNGMHLDYEVVAELKSKLN